MKTLWKDCENDEDRIEFLLSGRAYNTGIIAQSIVNEVAGAFKFRVEAWVRMAELEQQVSELRVKFMDDCKCNCSKK